jgi:hypothetical protein
MRQARRLTDDWLLLRRRLRRSFPFAGEGYIQGADRGGRGGKHYKGTYSITYGESEEGAVGCEPVHRISSGHGQSRNAIQWHKWCYLQYIQNIDIP